MYIQLILGEKCNLNCNYCHLGNKDKNTKIDKNTIIQLFEKLKFENLPHIIEYQGGEPFLYFDTLKRGYILFKKYFGTSVKFIITTNGLVLNQEILFFLLQNKNSISLNISFDGNDIITTKNRTKSYIITKTIIKNIQKILDYGIPVTLIGTVNKTWIKETNDKPEVIKEFLKNNFETYQKFQGQVKYFFRPEILLKKQDSYGIEPQKIISFFIKLSKLIDNDFYKIKNNLIEYNSNLEQQTVCLDYDGTIYLNDYYKSYLKRNFENLDIYKKIFNISFFIKISFYRKIINKILKEEKSKEIKKTLIENLLLDKNILLDINRIIEEIKLFYNLYNGYNKEKNIYYIFQINQETKQIYKNI